MHIYKVGGCVRDKVLGINPKDIDYVIVGATAAEIVQLEKQGFTRVGADFPVYLHPSTGNEYALARRERKLGVGYKGFECIADDTVTLEDDLSRRDLTMNAMAEDHDGKIIDPFGGREDIANRILRHVGPAFAEDPLRVLRAARFAARYDFDIHPDTMELMKHVAHEIKHVSRERIFTEMKKGFSEKHAHLFVDALVESGALEYVFPAMCTFNKVIAHNRKEVIDRVKNVSSDFKHMYAFICWKYSDRAHNAMFASNDCIKEAKRLHAYSSAATDVINYYAREVGDVSSGNEKELLAEQLVSFFKNFKLKYVNDLDVYHKLMVIDLEWSKRPKDYMGYSLFGAYIRLVENNLPRIAEAFLQINEGDVAAELTESGSVTGKQIGQEIRKRQIDKIVASI